MFVPRRIPKTVQLLHRRKGLSVEISMYRLSVPVFDRYLDNMAKFLGKAAVYAAEKKVDETVLTGMRLFPDMFPLTRQVMIAGDFAKGACARLAGVEVPKFEDTESTFAELQARCQKRAIFWQPLSRSSSKAARRKF